MRRKFAEVTITPRTTSEEELVKIIDTADFLGFKILGINVHIKNLKDIYPLKDKIMRDYKMELVSRIDVTLPDINLSLIHI